jgi:hypothetical protein
MALFIVSFNLTIPLELGSILLKDQNVMTPIEEKFVL